ncbi:golgin IMH1, putative [Entamoeba invadens IP1]|uniref:Golgin IMH1, putative n=1 Tax=Entamoeba invadens IP1 TaxID=370355 RepID=A0A0A1U8Q8_ENTIV|nr:golgin IMH1, putative [Entamoeba invadens IP1]ELP88368.1 golgin IMH1, putative [Entamoeba invadens IP1]|eukprot:XP_004255139.1 golgin IMH1, putative [Entamoeba invadens IP1]
MKLLLVVAILVVAHGIDPNQSIDNQYHVYIKSLTESMTEIKSTHGKKVAALQQRITNSNAKLNSTKEEMSKVIDDMKEKVVELHVIEKEVLKSRTNLEQIRGQIKKLKARLSDAKTQEDKKIDATIVEQLRAKKISYETISNNLSKKLLGAQKVLRGMKRTQKRVMTKIFKIKEKVIRCEDMIRKEKSRFERLLAQKKKLLKEANQLASDKKRFSQQKSIIENKITVLKEQIKTATKEHVASLESMLERFNDKIVFLTECVNDAIDREKEVFVTPTELVGMKEDLTLKIAQFNADKNKLVNDLKNRKYQVKKLKTKLKEAKAKKVAKEAIKEKKAQIIEEKEKIVELRRQIEEVRAKKDLALNKYSAKEKEFYRNKRKEGEKAAFDKLEKLVAKLKRVSSRILRIQSALRRAPTDKLKKRLRFIESEKKSIFVKVKVIEKRLLGYQKNRQQEFRVERIELKMQKERAMKRLEQLEQKMIAKKSIVESEEDSGKLVASKEYFLAVERAGRVEKKIEEINHHLNELQNREVEMLRTAVKRSKVLLETMSIKQKNFELQLATDMAGFYKTVNQLIVTKYNLDLVRAENAITQRELEQNGS